MPNVIATPDRSRWAALVLTGLIAFGAVAVQWGVVNARLVGIETRLDEFLTETRSMRDAHIELARRVAVLEGRAAQ